MVRSRKFEIAEADFENQYREARRRGREEVARGTNAVSASFDKSRKRIHIDLANGTTLLVPTRLIKGMRAAPAKALADIMIVGSGTGLYWPKLGIDIGVAGLLSGLFGTRTWMAELGRLGGTARTPAKAAASRANGRLGGRPRKTRLSTNVKSSRRAA